MILNSITLHNFMSYADATLDLTSITVACLAGTNGAGKSALLDATTWAIWEEARSSSDELIRLGQKEMWVDVRFEHENQHYRIRRGRQKSQSKSGTKGTSKGSLEFQILTGREEKIPVLAHAGDLGEALEENLENRPASDQNTWRSLTGGSLKDTQRLICELLRMDYDTFVNSAYLRQGRADEFTTRPPLDRKQILGEILGLSYFERLQEQCKGHTRTLKYQKDLLEQTLIRLPDHEASLVETQQEQSAIKNQLLSAETEKERWEEKANLLVEQKQRLGLLNEKAINAKAALSENESDIKTFSQQHDDLVSRLNSLEKLISSRSEIEIEIKQYESLRESVEILDQKQLLDQGYRDKKYESRSALHDLRTRLEFKCKSSEEILQKQEARRLELVKETQNLAKLEDEYAQYRTLIKKEAELGKQQDDFTRFTQRINELQSLVDEQRIRLEMELEQKKQACLETENLLKGKSLLDSQRSELESEENELEKLEAEKERVEQKGIALKSRKESINLQIQNVGRLVVEHQGKIAELVESKHSSVCPLCSSPIADRAAVIARYERLIEDARKETADLKLETAKIDDELVELRNKYKVFKERLDTRKELDKQIGAFREKQRAIERAEENQLILTKALQTLELRLTAGEYAQVERESLLSIKDQLAKLEFDPIYYNSLQAQVRAQRTVEPRYHQIQKDLSELKSIEEGLPALRAEIDQLKTALAEESYGKEIREVLNNLDHELEKLNYNRELHGECKQQLAKLLPVAERHRDLKKALEEKPLLSQSAKNLEELLSAKASQIASLNESLKGWQTELANLPNVEAEVEILRPRLEEAKALYDRLLRQSATIDARTNQLQAEIETLKAKREELSQTKQALEDYTFLAEAFGKKGIQAIIIENAIPEIETDANRLLSRLTDNRMHVALVTQQKNKTGNVVETLDILIGDEVGTRNYELYSGGEAFKVNFAIRVALSRLLARRSGAKLETLIIDEGFGSQDDQSRDRLVKAIRSIQDDFAKILVITHFSDVKEMFPTHILVSKQNGTSQIQLLS